MAWGRLGTIDAGRHLRWKPEANYGLAAVLALALAALLGASPRPPEPAPAGSEAGGPELPLSFVPNAGQHDAQVRYAARGPGYSFSFAKDMAALTLVKGNRRIALHLRFVGASPKARLVPGKRGAGRVNYLRGSKRYANLPIHESLTYRNLWPGIDMTFRGHAGALKYELRVAPGADPSLIRLAYEGSEPLSLAPSGALAVRTSAGTLADSAPRSYQRRGARRVPVDSRFAIQGRRSYGFEVGAYDRDRPLVIDPSLAYSTYLGEGASVGSDIAVDAEGNAYVVGDVFGCCTTHPTTPGAFDTTRNGADEAWVAKFDPSSSQLVYSTFLGGAPGHGAGIAVDDQGHAYVTGYGVVPITPGAYSAGTNPRVFITKLNQDGSAPIYSARFGGLFDRAVGIAIDEFGNAYVAGVAGQGFPTTPGAFDTTGNDSADPFALKLNATGTAPVYSTYLGGNGFEETAGIAVDRLGQAYVAGYTQSPNFPTTPGAHDETLGGQRDGFVTKLNPLGSELVYSTFLGGPNLENMRGIAVDSHGSVYATGYAFSHTQGPTGFPTTAAAYDSECTDDAPAYVTKLTPEGSQLAYSTCLPNATGTDIAVDAGGRAHVTGQAEPDFPTTEDAFDRTFNGGVDAYLTVFNAAGSSLDYSTYLGGEASTTFFDSDVGLGVAVDGKGGAYLTGWTDSPALPATPGAYDTTDPGGRNAFVAKFDVATAAPHCMVTGGGRIRAQNGDSATFSGTVRPRGSGPPSGRERYTDHGPVQRLKVKSNSIDSLVCEGRQATIVGTANVSGAGSTTFRIDVDDRGQPGRRDTYRILLGSGYDSGSQFLEGGNITIRSR